MPIALLLTELRRRRLAWTPVYADWCRLLATEELLWRRTRGAFLRSWFGPGLAMAGTGLLIFVANINALKSQFLFASSYAPGSLNLMEPLAGMAGALVGAVLGALSLSLWPFFPATVAVIFAVLASVFALAGAVAGLFANDPTAQAGYRAGAAVGRALDEFLTSWKWLTGPRNKIVNPIIRTALNVLDQTSVVTAQLAGLIVVLFARVTPWLARTAAVLPAFYTLGVSVGDLLRNASDDVAGGLSSLLDGPDSPLGLAMRAIHILSSVAKEGPRLFVRLIDAVTGGLSHMWDVAGTALDKWLNDAVSRLEDAIERTPVVRFFLNVGDMYDAVTKVLAAHFHKAAASPSGPGVIDKLLAKIPSPQPDTAEVHRRTAAMFGPMPPAGMSAIPVPSVFPFSVGAPLSSDLRKALKQPLPDAFAREWIALRERAGAKPGHTLRERVLQIRNTDVRAYQAAIGTVLDRMMGAPAAGAYAGLEPILEGLDRSLGLGSPPADAKRFASAYEFKAAPARLPVLDVRDDDRLCLDVPRLRIHYRGPRETGAADRLQAFGNELRALWIGQEYLMPAGS